MPRIETLTDRDVHEWRKSIGTAEKKGWERAVAQRMGNIPRNPDTQVEGDAARMTVPQPKPRSPEEVYDLSRRHFLSYMRRSREDFQLMVRMMRQAQPSLIAHLTDEQAAELLEKEWDKKIRNSLNRVYPKLGRGKELTIRTSGW